MKKIITLLPALAFTLALWSQTGDVCPGPFPGSPLFPPPQNLTPNDLRPPAPLQDRPVFPKDRIIFWIHGLGGNADSWAKAAQATQYQSPGQQVPGYPARKVTSLPLSYSQFSLSGAASTLHNALVSQGDPACVANHIEDKTVNFIIAHSQGGIVSRATDKMYDDLGDQAGRRFGGIVTFGSPHGGAQVLNNRDQFGPFAEEACNALIAGPVEDFVQDHPALDFFVPQESYNSIRNGLCHFLGDFLAPITFKDQFSELTEDYKVGAAPLAELNGHVSDRPHVAFYGVENEPVFYRELYHLKVKTPNQFPPFTADDDQFMVDKFNALLHKYRSNFEAYQMSIDYLETLGLPCSPADWLLNYNICDAYNDLYWTILRKRNAWQKGMEWLECSNEKYKVIIGANQSHNVNTYQCTCNGSTFPTSQPGCPPGCTQSGFHSEWLEVQHPNDGVVPAASAMAYPGAQVKAMPGSNHQQMRNDSNARNRLLELFEGNYGSYFITPVRQP